MKFNPALFLYSECERVREMHSAAWPVVSEFDPAETNHRQLSNKHLFHNCLGAVISCTSQVKVLTTCLCCMTCTTRWIVSLITKITAVVVVNMDLSGPVSVRLLCGPPAWTLTKSRGKMDETLKTRQFPGLIPGGGKEWRDWRSSSSVCVCVY